MQAVFRIPRDLVAALDADRVAVGRGQVELAERTDRQVFQHPVNRDVNRVFRPSVGRRYAARKCRIDVEIFTAEFRIDLEENALSLGFVAVAGRIILTESFGRQVGGDQRLRDQREIKMDVHGWPSLIVMVSCADGTWTAHPVWSPPMPCLSPESAGVA